MQNIENRYHIFEIINTIFILSFILEIFIYKKYSQINMDIIMILNIIILIILIIYGLANKKKSIVSIISIILVLSVVIFYIFKILTAGVISI